MVVTGGREERREVPADADGESTAVPVAALDYGHLAAGVAAGPVEDLVAVAVLGGGEAIVGVGVPVGAIVRVCSP